MAILLPIGGPGNSGIFHKVYDNGWGEGVTGSVYRGTNYTMGNNIRINNAGLKITGIPAKSLVLLETCTQSTGGKTLSNCANISIWEDANASQIPNKLGVANSKDTNGDGNGEYQTNSFLGYVKSETGSMYINNETAQSFWIARITYISLEDRIIN